MKKTFIKTKNSRGYAIIFSVVIISVVIIVTLAVASLVQRELELTSIGQQSMEAFFAADAGIECVLLADIKNRGEGIFPRDPLESPPGQISCPGYLSANISQLSGADQGYRFSLRSSGGDVNERFCADVVMIINGTDTTVKSTGFNNCDEGDPSRVERGLEVRY